MYLISVKLFCHKNPDIFTYIRVILFSKVPIFQYRRQQSSCITNARRTMYRHECRYKDQDLCDEELEAEYERNADWFCFGYMILLILYSIVVVMFAGIQCYTKSFFNDETNSTSNQTDSFCTNEAHSGLNYTDLYFTNETNLTLTQERR